MAKDVILDSKHEQTKVCIFSLSMKIFGLKKTPIFSGYPDFPSSSNKSTSIWTNSRIEKCPSNITLPDESSTAIPDYEGYAIL